MTAIAVVYMMGRYDGRAAEHAVLMAEREAAIAERNQVLQTTITSMQVRYDAVAKELGRQYERAAEAERQAEGVEHAVSDILQHNHVWASTIIPRGVSERVLELIEQADTGIIGNDQGASESAASHVQKGSGSAVPAKRD